MLISDVIILFEVQLKSKNIEVIHYFQPDFSFVYGDESQLKQVFINVIKNGKEAMPNGGKLLISTSQTEKNVIIEITDTGEGISETVIKKIGTPFFSTKENGTGLGMMITKKIIEEHNGLLIIKSEIEKGTVIRILIPPISKSKGAR
ncbi:ATP-binding protein [Evansella sp. AB-P1]|uniref:sensor histidine kinase n=1 Tax=Evansella sp. AB-P1 TaxID=3037653 RepID=UPI00241F4B39|nr:ATP-binding protein [Evansella sp. AB-P1]MDG5789559.1 ATP-binding protein [Evansella sp. AB-P1]